MNFSPPAGIETRSLLMPVDRVVMGLAQNLSPLGTKRASIALFDGMSISRVRICQKRRHRLSRMVIEITEICVLSLLGS